MFIIGNPSVVCHGWTFVGFNLHRFVQPRAAFTLPLAIFLCALCTAEISELPGDGKRSAPTLALIGCRAHR
jgi:hypothetical protein